MPVCPPKRAYLFVPQKEQTWATRAYMFVPQIGHISLSLKKATQKDPVHWGVGQVISTCQGRKWDMSIVAWDIPMPPVNRRF